MQSVKPRKTISSLNKKTFQIQTKNEFQLYHPTIHKLIMLFENFLLHKFETFLRKITDDVVYYWVCYPGGDNFIVTDLPEGKGFIALELNYRLTKKERNQYPVIVDRCVDGLRDDFALLISKLNKQIKE